MIRYYNRRQILLAVVSLLGSAVSYGCGWLFFRWVPAFAAGMFGLRVSAGTATWIAIACLLIVTASGYRAWKSGGGLQGYHESAFYHNMELVSGGSAMVDLYAHRITGSAHILSQIFMAGPLWLLRAGTLWKSRIPNKPGLENRLGETLSMLRQIHKWQPITEHPEHFDEILYLARMRKIDFSTAKGIPRIKADSSIA